MKTTLQQQKQQYLSEGMKPSEWSRAVRQARRKLHDIIARFGDANGARNEPWYLSELIEEIIFVNRFSCATLDITANAVEQIGLKKDSPCHTTQTVNQATLL